VRGRVRLQWTVVEPKYSLAEVSSGVNGFRLTDRDVVVLATLLDHTFLARRHLPFAASAHSANARLRQLVASGIVASATIGGRDAGATHVYSLTALGFDILLSDGNRRAQEIEGEWKAPYLTNGTRNNAIHQLAMADVAQAILSRVDLNATDVDWVGASRLYQRVQTAPGGARIEIAPDAALISWHGSPLLIEYERSLRPSEIARKMANYAAYYGAQGWKQRYVRQPKVLFAVNTRDNTQGYGPALYEVAVGAARERLLDSALFMRPEDWESPNLLCERALPMGPKVGLLGVLGLPESSIAGTQL